MGADRYDSFDGIKIDACVLDEELSMNLTIFAACIPMKVSGFVMSS